MKELIFSGGKWIALFIAIVFLVRDIELKNQLNIFVDADLATLFLVFLFAFLNRLFGAFRVSYLLSLISGYRTLSNGNSLKISLFIEAVGVLIPFSYAPEIVRITKFKKYTRNFREAILTSFVDRLAGFSVLFVVCYIFLLQYIPLETVFIKAIATLIFVCLIALCAVLLLRKNELFKNWYHAIQSNVTGTTIITVLLFSIVAFIFSALSFWSCVHALNAQISLWLAAILTSVSFIGRLVPVTFLGIGAAELSILALAESFELEPEIALGTVVMMLFCKYILGFIGFCIELYEDGFNALTKILEKSINKNM